MHSVVLNLVRSELEHHLLADLGPNATSPASQRCPSLGGVLSRDDLWNRLKLVPWYTELRNGRIPHIYQTESSGKHALGHWKAEEFCKFALVAPYVLREIVPKRVYRCFCLLSDVYRLLYSMELRILGWSPDHQRFLKELLMCHHVEYEALYGLSACTENVEYSRHMVEDVGRHSTPDNYWCHMYERMVKYYKQQTTNMKSLCKTFADRAAQLHFVQTYLATRCGPT